MVPAVRRLFIASCVTWFAGCQCVSVPEREYACESSADCLTGEACVSQRCVAPRVDGGFDAGLDAGSVDAGGVDAGHDAGGFDAGAGDAGADAGWSMCNAWACVTASWPERSDAGTGAAVAFGPIPADLDGGEFGWFGGVLLPDGRVLAIPNSSTRFLTFDPRTLEVAPFGAPLDVPEPPTGQRWPRSYAGGVLHPNGLVYVFPYQARAILEVNPADGGWREVGRNLLRADGGAPHYVGGVVDAYGTVWSASESSEESVSIVRYDPQSQSSALFGPSNVSKPRWGGWWGMARLPDDSLLAFPKEYGNGPSYLSPYILSIKPAAALDDAQFSEVGGFDLGKPDAGFAVQGGSLTYEGAVCATPAAMDSRFVCIVSNGSGTTATLHEGPVSYWGFNGTFSDGRVWTAPDSASQMVSINGNGQAAVRSINATNRYGFLGLVATPQGMVLIPGSPTQRDFMLVRPGGLQGNDTRPMPVLLSPYFNKL
ncbi:MAG: hypothetical protein DI536_27425 [Archangium gephyra]|uniref:Lipoprotein n=1 Tax=Archangium gephyra TaxID=48 RepID=A0A2W5UEQ8_9BACT|nr:MAG: hypothetical protein DI536_27425 [Archangium gephyra]